MKNQIPFLFLFLMFSIYGSSQNTKLMTYNIKYDNKNDTINNWNDRKESLVKLLLHYEPAIIGTQEALHHQVNYIDNALANFSYIGVGRDDGKQKGEYTAIHYNHTKFKLKTSNTFWLSKTPGKVSVGWDAAMERICTYGLFENLKTKEQFYVFNTHFDHMGKKARAKSAKLIYKKIKELNNTGLPLVLMGDLNLKPEEKPIQFLKKKLNDGKVVSQKPFYGPSGTFNGFNRNMNLDNRIDYIFVHDFQVLAYVHIDDRMENNKHISDHLPVLISLKKRD